MAVNTKTKHTGNPALYLDAGSADSPLLRRAFLLLEDGNWSRAANYFENVLALDPENSRASLGLLMAEQKVRREADFALLKRSLSGHPLYRNAFPQECDCPVAEPPVCDQIVPVPMETGKPELDIPEQAETVEAPLPPQPEQAGPETEAEAHEPDEAAADIPVAEPQVCDQSTPISIEADNTTPDTPEQQEANDALLLAQLEQERLQMEAEIRRLAEEADAEARRAAEAAEEQQRLAAEALQKQAEARQAEHAAAEAAAQEKAARMQAKKEAAEAKKQQRLEKKQHRKAADKKKPAIIAGIFAACAVVVLLVWFVFTPALKYRSAEKLLAEGDFVGAAEQFSALGNYKDAKERALEATYCEAQQLLSAEAYAEAAALFETLGSYQDSAAGLTEANTVLKQEADYSEAQRLLTAENYAEAAALFETLGGYRESADGLEKAKTGLRVQNDYNAAKAAIDAGNYEVAMATWQQAQAYLDDPQEFASYCAELGWSAFRCCMDTETPDPAAAASHLEGMKPYHIELSEQYRDTGYYELAKYYLEKELTADAKSCFDKISDKSRFDDADALGEEIRLLDIYQMVKNLTGDTKFSRNRRAELLAQLPDDYRDVASMR